MPERFSDYCQRKVRQLGDHFDPSGLDSRFIPFFESGERIKVETVGLTLTGTVSVTTGHRPSFLLMRTRRSIGSPWLLGSRDRILAVKRGRSYAPFAGGEAQAEGVKP